MVAAIVYGNGETLTHWHWTKEYAAALIINY